MSLNKLKDSEIRAADSGKLFDGGGLFIKMTAQARGKFAYRYTRFGKQTEMGLGGYPETSLKEARAKAEKLRSILKSGEDPKTVQDEERRERSVSVPTFEQMFWETFEALKPSLKGEGRAGRWDSPVRLHVLPKLGRHPVDKITQRDIEGVLKPIWLTKPDVARKALNRVNLTMQRAAAAGLNVDLQVAQKASALLGKQQDKRQPIPSMPWQEVPAFYQSLNDGPPSHLALRFLILTGLRSAPVRNLRHDHRVAEDLVEIPGELMKNGEGFRVPLSTEAQEVLRLAAEFKRGDYFFPGLRNRPLSDMTLAKIMKVRGLAARPHGFRSSLRVWLGEATSAPWNVAEVMLAHKVGSAVSRAYERTDYLEQRRGLLEQWGSFLTSPSDGEGTADV